MSDVNEQDKDKLTARPKRLELKKTVEAGQVRQSFSHGRSKAVAVEVRKKRTIVPPGGAKPAADAAQGQAAPAASQPAAQAAPQTAGQVPSQAAAPAAGANAAAPQVQQRPSYAQAIAAAEAAKAETEAREAETRQREAAAKPAASDSQPQVPAAQAPAARVETSAAASQSAAPKAPAAASGPRMSAPATGDVRPGGPRMSAPATGDRSGRAPQRGPAPTAQRGAAPSTQRGTGMVLKTLTEEEKQQRVRDDVLRNRVGEMRRAAEEDMRRRQDDLSRAVAEREAASRRAAEEETRKKAEEEARKKAEAEAIRRLADKEKAAAALAANPATSAAPGRAAEAEDDEEGASRRRGAGGAPGKVAPARPAPSKTRGGDDRRRGKLTISTALDENERVRSVASFRRRVEREKRLMQQSALAPTKVLRDVVVPETITVQELASRMAERGVDVIKALMKMGVMATINQVIDADTAELIVSEFGHRVQRVAESDIEIGLVEDADDDSVLLPRPPVVTVMGHVDHGKTSLLDALRQTDVAGGEAGGITQHIGAYQVHLKSGKAITFLDTPGHEAFTQMRARGAKATDIVVLVVAADDSVMPQTVEAIHHATAAKVPIVVAINKCDKPGANPDKVRRELLQHGIVVEQLGGEVQAVEVSAKAKTNLDQLEEQILLQAEILDLKANPDRRADGVVIEAKLERGRGSVATVLVQRGTLHVGDVFVAGNAYGRVRALIDDKGKNVVEAGPATPVEVLGLQGTPEAGDEFMVVENEARAREVAEFRQRKLRDARAAAGNRGTLEQMFSKIKAGEAKELPIVIKTDVQGSLEAILGSAQKLATEEVAVRVLHGAVGAINESDIALAAASGGAIIGFNVRASKQARDLAERDGVDIRYYSIIYNVLDDLKALLSGMLAPTVRERFLGYAEIREVFNITKIGKVAGCMVTEGLVKRGAKVRLLRDNVVIHEGQLSTLKRFKDDVREVKQGMDCGMSFENYDDIKQGDMIECFELETVARQL
ncbi:MAG: translation initiation factor IF-2 [Ferrovibrio sp.]|nr:translation initiation factor IF-2 [Ferrovibrio sp.]MBX3454556.1 translation initiation factor IF-2 [Ferrovibrio sp.]